MTLHVVRRGETVSSIARRYGVDAQWLSACNAVPENGALAVGQTLVVRIPRLTHVVREGETLLSIARDYDLTVRELWRRNWPLGGGDTIRPGETLVLSYRDEQPLGPAAFNGYAYPFVDDALLSAQLPYLTYLAPFTYGITAAGRLLHPDADRLLSAARRHGVLPVMHLSTLTEADTFDTSRGALVLTDGAVREQLIEAAAETAEEKDYAGIDVDFEYLPQSLGAAYASFLGDLRGRLRRDRRFLWAALAPKVRADQPGLLYEAHDYRAVGQNTDAVLLMTYEWGYTLGPPMAVSPIGGVRAVADYAVTEIPPGQIFLGLSNYGYDWPLPYVRGLTRARSISNQYAIALAVRYGAEIQYDETAQSPYFHYTDQVGIVHEVWFEDGRSLDARLRLIAEYGFQGGGVWNLMRPFPQIWQVMDALYDIAQGPPDGWETLGG